MKAVPSGTSICWLLHVLQCLACTLAQLARAHIQANNPMRSAILFPCCTLLSFQKIVSVAQFQLPRFPLLDWLAAATDTITLPQARWTTPKFSNQLLAGKSAAPSARAPVRKASNCTTSRSTFRFPAFYDHINRQAASVTTPERIMGVNVAHRCSAFTVERMDIFIESG